MDSPGAGDRSLTLLHLRKTFSSYLKEELNNHEQQMAAFERLLPLFNKIMAMFTPDELAVQFKEMILFCNQLCTLLVHEIRRRANVENTREAASLVYVFIRPTHESRGWILLKSIIFIVNSGVLKVMETICKTMLPSTLVKVVYLFFDLPPVLTGPVVENEESASSRTSELELKSRLYDSLVTLMNTLCSHIIVAEELIQKDDLILLFVGASGSSMVDEHTVWRDANFTFLCTIIGKALSSAVVKYIHSKGCIGHYLKNVRKPELTQQEKTILLCNIIDLLRSSADTTSVLIEDFGHADGYQTIVDFCSKTATLEEINQIFHALTGLITAGDETIEFAQPTTPLSFYNFKLQQTLARSTSTVRVPDAYLVLEKCFYDGSDSLCLLVLEIVAELYKSERMNYFIVDRHYSLYLFVERMIVKSEVVQQKVLQIVEFVLRDLNFIPCKELTALNVHMRKTIINRDFDSLERWLNFLFQILPVNINVKDAFRELLVLDSFLHIIQDSLGDEESNNGSINHVDSTANKHASTTQMAMDLLVISTKGNVLNAQFVTENLEMRMIKTILVEEKEKFGKEREELKTATLVLIKNLLYLAKNEQLFSSLLQLLFSDPGNIQMCMIILKLFTSVLLESHKVRIMFRRSGGYICLMTLLLHLEGTLLADRKSKSNSRQTLVHISMIFHVLIVSMRYEPSNAKYFLTEVRYAIINSILRSIGCFSESTKVEVNESIWENVVLEKVKEKLSMLHGIFQLGEIRDDNEVPAQISNAFFLIRLLFDLALDNYEKPSNDILWANEQDWLRSTENLETIPLVSFSHSRTILVHPSAVLCILYLLPTIGPVDPLASSPSPTSPTTKRGDAQQLEEWHVTAQFYVSLVLKAMLRSERNQQIMCEHDMPKILLEVGADLFKTEKHHPLLSPFHYLFERLACQSMHPCELRKFLRLDHPLCCRNLDDDDPKHPTESMQEENGGGGPVPIHRVKALVSMLTPRNHSLVHPPAFVEFDMAIEGFASLFIPSLSSGGGSSSPHHQTSSSSSSASNDKMFPPANGFSYLTWFYIDEFLPTSTDSPSSQHHFLNHPINLITIVRNFEGTEASSLIAANRRRGQMLDTSPNLENHLTCFYIQLNMAERSILISTAEHSVVDELRKDFSRPPDSFVKVPLSEQFFHLKQWTHLGVVMSRQSAPKVDIYLNGRCLASHRLNYVQLGDGSSESNNQPVHAIIGTPPFLRKATNLRWRMASMYLVDEPLGLETVQKIMQLQPHYVGNLQSVAEGTSAIVPEEKIVFSLNAISTTEVTAHQLRSMIRKSDCEIMAALLGISSNDSSTPLRVLWNTLGNHSGQRSMGAVVVGYLGMRTFAPCPVSALLDSIGGVAPLLGLIAMCSDSHGLYASLKVLVSAVQTNRSIVNSIVRTRGYQTLAMLLEEKAHLINSHILHLVLSLAGTVDGSKTDESAVIPNVQTFDDLLCDLDVWANAPDEVKKLLFEHFYELVIDNHKDNLTKVRGSSLLSRLLIFIFENTSLFPVKNDIVFRLIGAIVQPPCDPHSLLRLGQTISATASTLPTGDECEEVGEQYPFHIAELERLILDKALRTDGQIDLKIYSIYVRNRLLNMIATTLAHSSGQVNLQLCEAIVNTLGFGWALALCAPNIHPGTLYLALKIIVSITKYPALLEKFKDGSCNGGWLSDADSVIRNRAAVLLGFSVSAHGGAIGSHVDINPELSNCNGFAALEHVMYAHANRPFAYLAMLAILFDQHQPNIQPIDEFSIDMVWSHVFSLNEKSSVALAIQNVNFCPDVLVPLLSMVRAGLHQQKNEEDQRHWSNNYPIMVLQLMTFLYQNSEAFFLICHTETFVVTLFTTLIPPVGHQALAVSPPFEPTSFAEQNKSGNVDLSPTSAGASGRCVRNILELLTNILLNDLCLCHDSARSERLFDALVEYLDSGGTMCSQQSVLFTELVNACLERFMVSNMFFANSASMIPQSAEGQLLSQSSETTAINVVHFLSRVIDSVWNCLYRGNPIRILKCFLKLLAESHASNKAAAQLTCTEVHTNALFRIVLYLLSRPIDNVDTQMSVLDTLAEIVRNQHLLLATSKNSSTAINGNNPLFYGALVHLVFMLSEKPDIHHHDQKNHHLERGSAQVAMCAQSVWGMLWQQKKPLLDEIFKRDVDLELYVYSLSNIFGD